MPKRQVHSSSKRATGNSSTRTFNAILREAKGDPNILGFWLDGSRGKGLLTEDSDYDCVMLVNDDVLAEYKAQYEKQPDSKIELRVKTFK